MYYSEDIVEEVRSRNDIVDVISGYVRLTKKGSSYFGLCPFHSERSPSFSVSRQKQMYYCFGCGAGGNVYTFLMEYEKFTFVEAVKALADRAGINLPEEEYTAEAKARADIRNTLLAINKEAAKFYYAQLRSPKGSHAMEYLKGRKLGDEIMRKFGLGYSGKYAGELSAYLKKMGYTDEQLKTAGLVNIDEKRGLYDKFWNRVMFPIMDVNNRVIGFGGRVMGDAKPKYLNSPETPIFDKGRNLYGLNIARRSKRPYFLLCEGYMDVIALHQAGFDNAVASLGTALTTGHAMLLKRYVKEVYLTYDSDEAGTKAALRGVPILKDAGIATRVIRMDPFKDPDEYTKNRGAKSFEERIRKAENGFLFTLEVLERDYDMHSPEGKTAFFRAAALRLTEFEEELERNNYIDAVAGRYGIGPEALRKLVAKTAIEKGMARPVSRPKPTQDRAVDGHKREDGGVRAQRILLTEMASHPELYSQIRDFIRPEDFTQDLYRSVAKMLYEQYESGEIKPAAILDAFPDEQTHREVAAVFHTEEKAIRTPAEQEKEWKDVVLRVKRGSIEKASEELEPTDMRGLQLIMESRRKLQDLEALHISVN